MLGDFVRACWRGTLAVGLFICFFGATTFGQVQGSLHGEVADPSGAVVANASVTATAADGAVRKVASDSRGRYRLQALPPGRYTVAAQAPGFAVFQKPDVQVVAGRAVALPITLALSAAHAEVDVRANPVEVSVSPVQNASAVAIQGSDLKSLADDPDALLAQIEELAGPSVGPNAAEIYIDGFLGGDLPPKSAIRAIRVNQNPFSAAYDRLGYGRIEILTKPGSDTMHGSAFIIGNASAFNSESPFLAGSAQPPYHTVLYGGRVGGPLTKKGAYFLSLERRNINRDNLVNTETLNSSNQPVQFVQAVPNPRVLTSVTPRLDYQLTPNNMLTARYHFFGADELNQGVGSQYLPSQAYARVRHHHLLQASETQILSPRLINETRFQYLHFHNTEVPQDISPTLQVLGAFTGGSNSDGMLLNNEGHYEVQNLTSASFTRHYVQFGGFLRDIRRRESSTANFNGAFIFDSLANYEATEQDLIRGMTPAQIQAAGLGPSQFNITTGNPWARVNRVDGSLWAQDDWKARTNLTVSYGLRFESENVISDHADLAPRLGFSWGLGHGQHVKTVLRAGFGAFYERFDDDQMIQAQHLNGINQVSYVIHNPAFFPNVPPVTSLAAATASLPTVYRIAPNLRSPYALESAASIERQIAPRATVSLTYLNSQGQRQLLTSDINAPFPGTYNPAVPSSGVRPFGAAAGNVYEYISEGIYRQNQVIANFRVHRKRVSLFGYYVWNSVHSDTAGADSFSQNPWNILADYGRAEFGIRHRVFVAGSVAMPFGIDLYPMLIARSGIPFSITVGQDLFGTGIHNDRAGVVSASTSPADVRVTPYGTFDSNPSPASLFVPPNLATGPAAISFNLRLSRTFGFGRTGGGTHGDDGGGGGGHHHRRRGGLGGRGLASGGGFDVQEGGTERRYAVTLSVEAQNLFNDVNLGVPVGDLNSPLFGRSIDLADHPYSGEGDANRSLDLRLSFSF